MHYTMNMTREYSKFAINTHFNDLPYEAIERFKIRLLDSIGVIAASMHAGGIDECVDLFGGIGGAEEATILFHGVRLPADKASLVNSMMVRSFDYEPVGGEFVDGTAGAAHISGSSIPCMLAMGVLVHASGKMPLPPPYSVTIWQPVFSKALGLRSIKAGTTRARSTAWVVRCSLPSCSDSTRTSA